MSSASCARTKRALLYRESPNPHKFASDLVVVSEGSEMQEAVVIGKLAAPQPCVWRYE